MDTHPSTAGKHHACLLAIPKGVKEKSTVDVGSQSNARLAMNTLETALISISDELSRAGAYDNRFGHTISVLNQIAKSTKISRGRIMDADVAAESTRLSKAQVLSQANTAMLAQANKSMSTILSVFN